MSFREKGVTFVYLFNVAARLLRQGVIERYLQETQKEEIKIWIFYGTLFVSKRQKEHWQKVRIFHQVKEVWARGEEVNDTHFTKQVIHFLNRVRLLHGFQVVLAGLFICQPKQTHVVNEIFLKIGGKACLKGQQNRHRLRLPLLLQILHPMSLTHFL